MRIYVGNLPYQVSESDLESLFSPYGEVREAVIISDRTSGRSKGFGFVEMPDDNAARKAIEGLNGKDVGGRGIVVNEARPRREGGFHNRRGNRRRRNF